MNNQELNFTVEIPEGSYPNIYVNTSRKKREFKGMQWSLIFVDLFDTIARDKELNITDVRVLHGLLSYLDYGNVIDISQGKLAKELKIRQPNISASIKKLISKEYILILGQKGRQNIYTLNPNYGLRGKAESKPILDRSWEQRRWEQRRKAKDKQ